MWAVIAGEIIGMVIGLALVFAYFVRQVVRTERRYGKPGRVLDAVRYLLGRS